MDYYYLTCIDNDSIEDIATALYWYSVAIGEKCLLPYEVENDETAPTSGHAWELMQLFASDYGIYVETMILADAYWAEYVLH